MKNKLISLLILSLLVFSFAGCGAKDNANNEGTTNTTENVTTAPVDTANNTPVSGDAVKTGLAVISTAANSKDAGEGDGVAQADSYIVAVTVDKDGKIVKCIIDSAQTKINFSKTGEIITDINATFKTKNELKDEYGMKKASSIGKEWYEQAEALSEYVVGKTVEEIKGIAVNEKGAPSDAELASSVTISIGSYVDAIEKAVSNAQNLGAQAEDKLGLAVTTNIKNSKNAGEEDGLAQAYSSYAVATFDASGKITSCIIEGSQVNVNFSKDGKITSDINATQPTKHELGDNYGMKKASSIGKEWYEQADALAQYVVGKTAEEVKGISVNEKGAPTDSELATSVTVSIGGYVDLIEKASTSAK